MNRHKEKRPIQVFKTVSKTLLPVLFLFLALPLFGQPGATITFVVTPNCANPTPIILTYTGTDATGRHQYAHSANPTVSCGWNNALSRWEFYHPAIGLGTPFVHSAFASTPNPPDKLTGNYQTGGYFGFDCIGSGSDSDFNITGTGTQNTLGGCSDIVVNSTADNLTAGDGNCTLREAIRNANAGSDLTSGDCDCGTTITFDASTNGTPIVLNLTGAGEDNAATGDLDIREAISIMGNGQGQTIIDGNATDRVFDIPLGLAISDAISFQDLTIQNGNIDNGAGLSIQSGNNTIGLTNVTFDNNTTTGGGGSIFYNNVANGPLNVSNCIFSNNTHTINVAGTGSAGIHIRNGNDVTIDNTLFDNNESAVGGAIFHTSFHSGSLNVTNSCFQNNGSTSATGSFGGAVNNISGRPCSFTNCTFTANGAASGAAMLISSAGAVTNITNCTFAENNLLGTTGALVLANGDLNLINNIIVNNNSSFDFAFVGGTITTNTKNIVGTCSGANCPTFFSTSTDVICGIATCGNGLCHYPVRSGSDADGTADVSSPIANDICGNARNAAAYNIGSSEEDYTDTEDPVVTCPGNVSQHADNSACSAVVTYTGATSTDNCGVVMVSSNPASGATFNVGTTTVTATASDAAGNMGSCTFTVTVVDNQAPTVTCPPNQSAYVATGQSSTTVNSIPPSTSNDNCSIASTTYSIMGATTATGNDDASGTSFNVGMSNVAYTVTDPAGLTGMCNFSITVIQCGDITVNSTADNLTAGDGNCTLREAIRNANAGTDLTNGDCDCGNTIRFDASTNGTPIIIALAGANENANATGDFDITATFGVTIIGNGESNTIIDGANLDRIFDVVTTGPVSIQTLTIQNGLADDFGGGILCATQFADITLDQVNVDNCEALSGGGISMSFINISLAMTSCSVTNNMATIGSGGGLEFYGSSMMVTDCVFNNNMSGSTGGGAEINTAGGTVSFLRTCFVSNSTALLGGGINHLNGNVTCTNCTFSDNEASIGQGGALSSFAFPGTNLSVINCTAAENTSAVGGGFSITQNGGNIDMINTILADNTASGGSGHDLYIDAGTLTTNTNNIVEDCLGNALNAVVCPTFFSSDDPQLQPITTCGALCYYPLLDCSTAVGAGDQNATGVPTTDICGTAHGAATNIGSSEATTADTETPVANCPGTQTASNTAGQCGANVSFTIPDPTDNCSATSSASPASGSFFNVGTTQVTVTATDGAGNTDQCTFNISVEDTENPTVTCPSDITVSVDDATNCTAIVNYTTPTASDNCSGVGAVSCSPASGSVFALGSNTVTCSATDNAGNTGQCTFNVIVQQPDIMVKGDYATIMNGSTIISSNIATSSYNGQTWSYQLENLSTASGDMIITSVSVDNPAFDLTQAAQTSLAPGEMTSFDIQFNPQGNEICNIQDATVTIVSNDCNDPTFTFAIQGELSDNQNPTVACPSDITVSVDDATNCTAVVNFTTPTASDNCSGVGAVSCSPASGSVFALGSNTVTCSATDNAGNTGQCTFNVIVQQPDIMVKGDYATIMNGSTIISSNIATSSYNGQTWSYQLENLSTASGNLIITSVSVDNPAFDLTQAAQTSLAPGEMTSFDIQFNPQGNEICNIQDATVTIVSNDCNDATFTFAIQGEISDNEDPTVSCPSNVTQLVDMGQSYATVNNIAPTSSNDNCTVASTTHTISGATTVMNGDDDASGTQFNIGSSVVTYTVMDAAGNTDQCSFNVNINGDAEIDVQDPGDNSLVSGVSDYDFGNVNVSGGSASGVFTINNLGDVDLLLNGNPDAIAISGSSSFSVTQPASTSITPTNSTTFQVAYNPANNDCSEQTATISIANNDPDENPFTFTVTATPVDNVNPVANCLGTQTVNNDPGQCGTDVFFSLPSPTDNCPGVTSAASPASGSFFNVGTTQVTVTATDAAGNTNQCTFDVVVNDNEDPTAVCLGTQTVNNDPGQCGTDVFFSLPNPTDNCPGATSAASPASGSFFNVGTTQVTVTATDAAGNTDQCTFDVVVNDNEDPTAVCLGTQTVNNDPGQCGTDVFFSLPNPTDNCPGATSAASPASGSFFNVGTTQVTVTATDAAGNTDQCTFDVIVNDNEDPTAVCLGTQTVNIDPGQCGTDVFFSLPSPTDNCPGATSAASPASGSFFNVGTTQVTVTATDAAGNTDQCTFDVVVNDNENPTAVCLGTQTVNNDPGQCGTDVFFSLPSPTDNCPGATSAASPASGSFFNVGTTQVTVTATDAAGNTDQCTFDVVVNDNEDPTAVCLGTQTVNNDPGQCGTDVFFSLPSPTDNCPGATSAASPASGSFFNVGTTQVTVTATDAAGNTDQCTFDVVVNDNEDPTAVCLGTQTVNNDPGQCGTDVFFSLPNPTDNCPGATSAASPASGSFFNVGTTQVTVTATDAAGNTDQCTFDVVVNDNEDPTAVCLGTQTVNNDPGQCGTDVFFSLPNPTDNCPGATSAASPASGSFFNVGTTQVTVTATDAAGNTDQCTFDVVVNDNEDPVVTGSLTTLDVEGCSASDAPTPYMSVSELENAGVSISDNCSADGDISVNVSSATNGTCPIVMTRTYSVTDEAGNESASFTQTINIDDNIAPTVSGTIADTDVEGCSVDDAPAPFADVDALMYAGMTITDACTADNNLMVNVSSITNGTCPIVMTRTYSVTDECGNESTTFTHVINIDDTNAPTITVPAMNLTVDCDGNGNMTQLMNWLDNNGDAQASDACGYTWSNDFNMTGGGLCANSANMVTFTATDACGNTSTTSATFTIQDNDAPTVSGNLMTLNVEGCTAADAPAPYTTVAELENAGVTITDACSEDANITVNVSATTNSTCPIVMTRTYTVTDACSNESASFTQTINIDDNTPPSIDTDASNSTVECDGAGNTAQLNAWLAANGNASASDICSNVTWSNNYTSLSDDCGETGTATVTFTATDDCGNSSSTTATFTIEDTTPPGIDTDASNSTVECDGAGNTAQLNAWLAANGNASASDVCSNVTWSNNFSALSDDCGETGAATVTFTATDDCGNASSTTATFTIEDTTPPSIDTDASNSTVECDGAGNMAELNAWLAANGHASASDVCSNVTWSNDFSALSDDCGETGTAAVTFTATDDCGNTSSTTATFTIEDTTPPSIDTDASNSTVECDGAGNTAELNAWLAANGHASASDVCSNVNWSNDFSALSDDCGETGTATVTFTATDDCGNSSSTTATFTIEDTTPPSIDTDASNSTVECDGAGNTAELNAWLAANGHAVASDICSNVTWSNDFTAFVPDANCPNTGSVTVTFTATDDCGNSSATTATFTIEDTTPPTPFCNNITVQLDVSGEADITVTQIDNNSSDLCCGLASLVLDRTTIFCNEVPSTTVTLTATDFSGNSASCDATITVEDNVDPTAICQDVTVEITPDGTSALTPAEVDNRSFDNCDIGSMSLSKTNFVCADLGDVDITLTVTDVNGNASSCMATATVTIQPGLPGAWNGAGIGDTGGTDPDFEFDPCTATDPADGEFDISSNGNNAISTSTDNVAFAYQDLCGDFTVTAKIENVSNNGYGGLMVRETGDAGAKQTSLFSNLTNILRHEVRYTEDGPKQVFSFFKPSPIWLRIQRQGSFIFFYYSTTGTAFQYVHAVNLPMNSCVQVGLATFSFIPGQQATATFSNVEVVGTPATNASIPNTPSIYEEDFQKTPVLFPNPTNQTANLVFADPLATDTRVVLRNQLGQVIEMRTLDAGSYHSEWDVSTLTDGIYLLEIHSEGRNPQVLRLVKAQ